MEGPAAPRPLHAPYAGRHRPFTIGMAPLAEADWIETDDRRAANLAEKAGIFAAHTDAYRAEPDMAAAEAEALALIAAHLAARGLGDGRAADWPDAPPLVRAAMMVQDDLVLMRRGADAWRLASAALAFPSAWSLAEKFGRPMDTIHANVPGWAGPMGARVARIFDALQPDAIVWRLNWSLQFGGGLRMDTSKHEAAPREGSLDHLLVRVERQTLRKLPASGDILFTIKVMLDPVAALAAHPEGPRLARGLADQLAGLDADELAYKGLTLARERILARLDDLAQPQAAAV
ncbi:heme-dependent oxidative N-demethylase family protein [Acuticoccus kandeliae]|uniref:heme-dependent oxidative N-demethylase family protein n=1 Tax=Acuticoccus kandeliae TaxID=2073160 RepID=UPI000D3E944B|nr:DUF3445 domain-containing protein [Acuticoccus kandeliae]